MKVLSAPGTQCPREEDPTSYVPDSGDPVDVPDTMYYRRLVNDGSLIRMDQADRVGVNQGMNQAPPSGQEIKHGNAVPSVQTKSKKEVTTDGK